MADYQTINAVGTGARTAQLDEGLRAHMNKVYGLMSVAMLITAGVAWAVGTNDAMVAAVFGTPFKWVAMFLPLVMVFAFSAMINRMSVAAAQLFFYAYAAAVGLSLSFIFAVYTGTSITQTFLVTSIAFAGLSLYGYTTKKDLSGMGSFLIMGVVGLIVAMLLNAFVFKSGVMGLAISALGVLIFAGLTAYDTQRIKSMYAYVAGTDMVGKTVIMGALSLYLDFINLFQFLLSFMGNRN